MFRFLSLCAMVQFLILPMQFSFAAESDAGVSPATQANQTYPVPDWVYDSIADLDVGYGYGITSESQIVGFRDLGVNVVSISVRSHAQDIEADAEYLAKIRREAEWAQKHKMRWFGYVVYPTGQETGLNLGEKHPDWRVREKPDGPLEPLSQVTAFCMRSPFGQRMIDQLAFIAREFHPDGFLLDGLNYVTQFCYCDYCREKYRKETGHEIPLKADLDDPDYIRYVRWRDKTEFEYVEQIRATLRKINPNMALMPWILAPGRWWHQETPVKDNYRYEAEVVDASADFPLLEMFWDWPGNQEGPTMPDFTLRSLAGMRRGLPFGPSPNCAAHGQQPTRIPQVEELQRTATIIANGGTASPTWGWMKDPVDYRAMVKMIKDRQPWTTRATSMKWAAMAVSENTRFFYGRQNPRERYTYNCLGAFRAFQEEHLPLDVITDRDLEEGGDWLAAYKVIVLANTACLSDRAMENLRKYVAQGGGLVATYETSLFNQDGQRRADLGLGDLLGAQVKGYEDNSSVWPNMNEKAQGPSTLVFAEHAMLTDPVIERSFAVDRIEPGDAPKAKVLRQTDFIGRAINVAAGTGTNVIVKRRSDTPKGEWPALILSEHGKGKVAYFPNGMDEAYFRFPLAVQRRLLTNAVRWAAAAPAPIIVEAPQCVYVTAFEKEATDNSGKTVKKAGEKQGKANSLLIVHLLNEVNTQGGKSLTTGSPSQREEMLPITNIRVKFRDANIRRVTLQPEGKTLRMKKDGDFVEVTVPLLEIHSMVVAERGM